MTAATHTAPHTPRTAGPQAPLLEMLTQTASTIDELSAELDSLRPQLVRDPSVEADYMTALRRLATAEQTTIDVNAALGRLADGRYGRCVVCGRQIPPARLELRPHTASCVTCG